jgi:hypothetical protein
MTYAANLGYNALHLGKKRLWPWTNYFIAGGPSWADSSFVLFLSFLWWARCELLPCFGLGWIVFSFLRAPMADAQVFLRSAIIDENCLTVDMDDIAPHSTLFLTAVPLPYYHACATQPTYSKASSSVRPIQGGRRTSQQAHVPQLRLNSIRCTSDLTTSLYKSHVRPHLSALLLFLPAAPFSSSCHSFWCVALLCAAVERAPGDTKSVRLLL